MNGTIVRFRTVFVGIFLTVLWICAFLFIKSTLEIEFNRRPYRRLALLDHFLPVQPTPYSQRC